MRQRLCNVENAPSYPLTFCETQLINPFLSSMILANHVKVILAYHVILIPLTVTLSFFFLYS